MCGHAAYANLRIRIYIASELISEQELLSVDDINADAKLDSSRDRSESRTKR
jgi:hypothetical protein